MNKREIEQERHIIHFALIMNTFQHEDDRVEFKTTGVPE